MNFAPANLAESLFTLGTEGATLSFGTLLTYLNAVMILCGVGWLLFCLHFLSRLKCFFFSKHKAGFRVFVAVFLWLQVLIKRLRFYFWLLKIRLIA